MLFEGMISFDFIRSSLSRLRLASPMYLLGKSHPLKKEEEYECHENCYEDLHGSTARGSCRPRNAVICGWRVRGTEPSVRWATVVALDRYLKNRGVQVGV